MTCTGKRANAQAANSFVYWKKCKCLTTFKMQNLTRRFLEIRIIIEVMTSSGRKFRYFLLQTLTFTYSKITVNSNCLRQIVKKANVDF